MRKIPNTFGIDVTAARFLEYGSEDELLELIAAGQVVAPWLHIGGGSNLLFIKDYEGTVLHSRCLLYTSPSPRDMRRSRMPSSA